MHTPDDLPPAVFLDPWLTAKGDALKNLSETIIEEVERKICSGLTQKARRDALARRRTVVENLAANFAALTLSPHVDSESRLAAATAKRKPNRYDRLGYPQDLLGGMLRTMEEVGHIVRHPYVFKRLNTTLELSPSLITSIGRHRVRLHDIGRMAGAEPIWLNARTGKVDFADGSPLKQRVDYQETGESSALRAEMDDINAFLGEADFRFDGEAQVPPALRRMFLLRSLKDTAAFNLNGRLFGGWWQDLKSDLRHLITIGGEPIADLDYSACFASLAYVRVAGRPGDGDPYDIPGLEDHRAGAKEGMLSLLSRSKGMERLTPELKAKLPEGWTARHLVEAFIRRHPLLADTFGQDIGVELMATESRIMVALLLELEALGIPAMPLHDGVQVAESAKGRAIEAMAEVSERVLGTMLAVKEKPIVRPMMTARRAAA
ncbi:hypothetical protein [Shinella sp.]|uniref:hypothetical protein n=1 Tax=Shinella sp. TaxID=1870904 RepID=UPI00301C8DC3